MKNMIRRITALFLTVLLTLCLVPAYAAGAVSNSFPQEKGKNKEVILEREKSAVVMLTKVNSGSGKVTLTVKDATNKNAVIKTETRKAAIGSVIEWEIDFDKDLPNAKQPIKHYVMSVVTDKKEYTYSIYLTYHKKEDNITVEPGTWYPDNTACVQGLPLRDMPSPRTDKWYHVLPLDLTQQGSREYKYIAGNMYIIGTVTVAVDGDTVTVSYHNNYEASGGNTKTLSEYMNIFHNLSGIKNVDPERLGAGYAFGQPISITSDLGGDTNVLLYVLNRVTYCDYVTGTHKLTRYWPNLKENKQYRNDLEQLMKRDDDSASSRTEPGVN